MHVFGIPMRFPLEVWITERGGFVPRVRSRHASATAALRARDTVLRTRATTIAEVIDLRQPIEMIQAVWLDAVSSQ